MGSRILIVQVMHTAGFALVLASYPYLLFLRVCADDERLFKVLAIWWRLSAISYKCCISVTILFSCTSSRKLWQQRGRVVALRIAIHSRACD